MSPGTSRNDKQTNKMLESVLLLETNSFKLELKCICSTFVRSCFSAVVINCVKLGYSIKILIYKTV